VLHRPSGVAPALAPFPRRACTRSVRPSPALAPSLLAPTYPALVWSACNSLRRLLGAPALAPLGRCSMHSLRRCTTLDPWRSLRCAPSFIVGSRPTRSVGLDPAPNVPALAPSPLGRVLMARLHSLRRCSPRSTLHSLRRLSLPGRAIPGPAPLCRLHPASCTRSPSQHCAHVVQYVKPSDATFVAVRK
jgi:hypothetical protein